jgi:hypothetical protein
MSIFSKKYEFGELKILTNLDPTLFWHKVCHYQLNLNQIFTNGNMPIVAQVTPKKVL